jgi:hypothetical protein
MLQAAAMEYGFEGDDRLDDTIAGLSSIFCSIGEIAAPLSSGVLITVGGFGLTCVVVGAGCLGYGVLYLATSGILKKKTYSKVRPELTSELSVDIKTNGVF